ncbi:MAG TPA: methyltransferase domain-containing protein [Aldersonia sp.]
MFALTDSDLTGTVLDCPGGGSSFTAAAAGRGCDAVAVDPVYADPPDQLAARQRDELDRGRVWASTHADRYVWDFYGGVDGHTRTRSAAAQAFLSDLAARPDRYRCASLPDLPFPDASFDLVLSSHLLFTYADRLDLTFHRAALLELVRVSRRDVRVFPLLDQSGRAMPEMVTSLTDTLAAQGISHRIVPVAYEFQRGGDRMLVLHRSPH